MEKPFTITIENPCGQNWEEMKPSHCGRFCMPCQKIVVDFTAFSDEEFIAHFQKQETASCGKFTDKQLSIVVPSKPKRLTFWSVNKYVFASLIAALGLSFKAVAQPQSSTAAHSISTSKPNSISSEKLIIIRGIVTDEFRNPLQGTNITIKNQNYGAVTDINGRFQLELPEQDATYILVCSCAGMITQEISQYGSGKVTVIMENETAISLKELQSIKGGISIHFIRNKPTIWQRLTRPFRKKMK